MGRPLTLKMEIALSDSEFVVSRVDISLAQPDVGHGYCWRAVIQHLTDPLDAHTIAMHDPAKRLSHRMRSELNANLVAHIFECFRYCKAGDWFALGSIRFHFK